MDTRVKDDIKFNCDLSDARYWGYFSICGLLLRYRDLYRSEQGLKAWSNINREEIAAWIQAKEARWPELEEQAFRPIVIGAREFDPFDVSGINDALNEEGLVYGAGYGMYLKPTFFLAELRTTEQVSGLVVHTTGREIVRDLLTAPAMLQDTTVYLRLEPLLVLLHFKLSEAQHKHHAALRDAFAAYGLNKQQLMDDTLENRLQTMAEEYSRFLLAHEIAEFREGIPEWKEILSAAGDRRNEHFLRALKDLIADTSESGPLKLMIDEQDQASLGLWAAFLEGFPRVLFPEIREAWRSFIGDRNWSAIDRVRKQGYERFLALRDEVIALFRSESPEEFPVRLGRMSRDVETGPSFSQPPSA